MRAHASGQTAGSVSNQCSCVRADQRREINLLAGTEEGASRRLAQPLTTHVELNATLDLIRPGTIRTKRGTSVTVESLGDRTGGGRARASFGLGYQRSGLYRMARGRRPGVGVGRCYQYFILSIPRERFGEKAMMFVDDGREGSRKVAMVGSLEKKDCCSMVVVMFLL
ncbi:hypothetical protein PoB_006818400 [Plakobranchus ocellatus]|uniref:Uncharacterized protein n=1 Tax=Plakobranchus ocellatus TaxID=259542 RepID=A0AAV4DBU0_9GAST|nr:hypothetical protein PoB_006818400 [Plakobranchus ocellatus]